MTAYQITASNNGITQDSAEVLGNAYGKTYIDRADAEVVCADLNDTADDYYPGTVYAVETTDAQSAICYGIDCHAKSGELYATKSAARSGDFISVIGPLHYTDAEAIAADPQTLIGLEWLDGEVDAQWAQTQEWTATDTQIEC